MSGQSDSRDVLDGLEDAPTVKEEDKLAPFHADNLHTCVSQLVDPDLVAKGRNAPCSQYDQRKCNPAIHPSMPLNSAPGAGPAMPSPTARLSGYPGSMCVSTRAGQASSGRVGGDGRASHCRAESPGDVDV